jgi:hypothetical protein
MAPNDGGVKKIQIGQRADDLHTASRLGKASTLRPKRYWLLEAQERGRAESRKNPAPCERRVTGL